MKYEVVVCGTVVNVYDNIEDAKKSIAFYSICHPVDCIWIREA